MLINETIKEGVNIIMTEPTTPLWIKLLALAGAFWLFQTTLKTGGSIITFLAYVVGFFKWIYYKIQRKDI